MKFPTGLLKFHPPPLPRSPGWEQDRYRWDSAVLRRPLAGPGQHHRAGGGVEVPRRHSVRVHQEGVSGRNDRAGVSVNINGVGHKHCAPTLSILIPRREGRLYIEPLQHSSSIPCLLGMTEWTGCGVFDLCVSEFKTAIDRDPWFFPPPNSVFFCFHLMEFCFF